MIAIISDNSNVVKWLLLFQIKVKQKFFISVIFKIYFNMLYNCGWILKLDETKQWFSVLKMTGFVTDWLTELIPEILRI